MPFHRAPAPVSAPASKDRRRYGLFVDRSAVLQQAILKFPGLLRFRQLRFQVFAQMLRIRPRRVTKRASRPVNETESVLDERTLLQG